MKNQNLYKKDDLFKDEEEPIPEKYTPPINSPKLFQKKSRNSKNKSNIKSKSINNSNKQINSTKTNNISLISQAKTSINNQDLNKYENFNIQNQYYKWQKAYLNLHPDINNPFIERMEFDSYKRKIKEKEINKLIGENTLKIEEEKRAQTFTRLFNDANRRNEAMDNLEKMKNILNNNNAINEEALKKYSDEQWKKIYDERFKTYMEKIKEKNDVKAKNNLELKLKKENDEINLCKVKKASKKHIEEHSNKMYTEALKRKMKNKEKLMRLKNDKNIFDTNDGIDYSNTKYKKKIKESPYNFNDDENENNFVNNKSIDLSNYIIEKNSSHVQSIQESKNIGKIMDNFELENNQESNENSNINLIGNMIIKNNNINEIGKEKKIQYNFFEEEYKEQNSLKESNLLNNKDELYNNFYVVKIDNVNISDEEEKNIYQKEVSYIIDQFFLRKNEY